VSPKRNTRNSALPRHWRHRYGAYYYRVPPGEEFRWDGKKEFLLGHTLAQAHRTYAMRQEHVGNVQLMSQLCDRYVLEVLPLKAPATQRSNQYSLRRVRTVFGDNPVDAITPQHIYQYRDHVGRTESKKKANLDLEVLSHLFTKSIEWGSRGDHPMAGKKVVKFSLKARTRYVTDAEVVSFAETLPPKWQLFVSLALWTGRRKAELLALTRHDVLEQGLRFTNNKRQGDTFTLGWTDELSAIVRGVLQHREKISALHLFHTREGKPYLAEDGTTSGFDSIWQRYMRRWSAEGNERFTLHDIRAKRASDLDLDQARTLLRHTDAKMTQKTYRRKADVVKF
jgi:integrase